MRWLHTSDWHLGRGFHGTSLRDAQQEMLETVCAAVVEEGVDVLLVSGDVHDRALPPEWAVTMLEDCLKRLVETGVQVIITSGNHDSARRLGFGSALMRRSGVHLRTALEDAWTPVMLPEPDGSALQLVYGIPYLEPQLIGPRLGLARATHTAVMRAVTDRIRADVAARAEQVAAGSVDGVVPEAPVRTVVMAHLFAARGVGSDSERIIGADVPTGESAIHDEETAGGLAVVPLEVFDGFDQVALGHLHGRQRLSETVRYSGSPLRLSFSETDQAKGAWLWDSATPEVEPRPLDWSIGRPLARLEGTIDEILDEDTVAAHAESFVQITLTDEIRPERAHQRVQQAYPHLATFTHRPPQRPEEPPTYSAAVEAARTEPEVVGAFLAHVRGRGASEEERGLIDEALAAVRAETGGVR
ncbi:exonuclease SbcCD subunit D [Nesterenkonia sp. F]|uniref:exonuclease SbcCD subunit D n=1 Tax=Nesterenkonia sp. F TaxID=795955 RepID=UPI000255D9A7|nr:exonuclease SbcCD subunit D [Nesterenkonia sp. F]